MGITNLISGIINHLAVDREENKVREGESRGRKVDMKKRKVENGNL